MTSTYGSSRIPASIRIVRRVSRTIGTVTPRLAGYLAFQMFCTPMKREHKPLEFNPRKIKFQHNNRTLTGYEWEGQGKTVLLVHGWESSASRFRSIIPLLVEQGFRIVALDAPAHGVSEGLQTNPIDYANSLYAFVQEIGQIDIVIGHSLGCSVAMFMLDTHPELNPEKIVLIGAMNRIVDGLSLFASLIQLPDKAFYNMKQRVEDRAGHPVERFTVASMVSKRTEQALIVHDKDDTISPLDGAHQIAGSWSTATLYETEGLGHRRILHDKQTLQSILNFLD